MLFNVCKVDTLSYSKLFVHLVGLVRYFVKGLSSENAKGRLGEMSIPTVGDAKIMTSNYDGQDLEVHLSKCVIRDKTDRRKCVLLPKKTNKRKKRF